MNVNFKVKSGNEPKYKFNRIGTIKTREDLNETDTHIIGFKNIETEKASRLHCRNK